MNLKELDEMAYDMQTLPKGMKMPETYYFLTMRALYAAFLSKKISVDQAQEEKKTVISTYRAFELVYRIGEHDMNILRQIQSNKSYYDKNGCPVCKQLANQICGLALKLESNAVKGGE